MQDAARAFLLVFRRDIFERLEYSFGNDAALVGTMTAGEGPFADRAAAFAEMLPYARAWSGRVRAFVASIRPFAYLLRASWRDGVIEDVTLYCRFRNGMTRDQLASALDTSLASTWRGPEPWTIASMLHLDGPTGIGLRINSSGASQEALYYRSDITPAEFVGRVLPRLVDHMGLGAESSRMIGYDFPRIHRAATVGVIGVDGDAPSALKIDPARVPMPLALEFFRRRGATAGRLAQLSGIVRTLGVSRASYVGMKYGVDGFIGWKLYISMMPHAAPFALAPVIDANQPTRFK